MCAYTTAVAEVNRSVAARACVAQAEGQCRAGQLLAGLGLDISLPGLRAATPAAAKDLLTFLLTKLADTVPPLSESRSPPPSLLSRLAVSSALTVCRGLLTSLPCTTAAAVALLHRCLLSLCSICFGASLMLGCTSQFTFLPVTDTQQDGVSLP